MPYSPPRHNAHRAKADKAARDAEYNAHRRTGGSFYKTARWTKLRSIAMKMNPLCVQCKAEGIINMGDVIDHIIPIKQGGEKLSLANLQTLCHLHHNRKSAGERSVSTSQAAQDAL